MTTKDDLSGFNPDGFVMRDPQTAALMTKMVADPLRRPQRNPNGDRKLSAPQNFAFKNDLARRAKFNQDAKLQLKTTPDIRFAADVLKASIMSPGDMISTEVPLAAPRGIVSSELAGSVIQMLTEYFDTEYDLRKHAPEHLEKALINEGSAPILVVPENVVDSFINGGANIGMESLRSVADENGLVRPIGILGRSEATVERRKIKGLAVERFTPPTAADRIDQRLLMIDGSNNIREDDVVVTDNLAVLKFSMVNQRLREQAAQLLYKDKLGIRSYASESYKRPVKKPGVSDMHIETALHTSRSYKMMQVDELRRPDFVNRKTLGKPMIIDLPSESVLPVHVPGDPKKHVGYFIILDEEGNPIKALGDDMLYRQSPGNLGSGAMSSLSSNIIQRVNTNIGNAGQFDFNNKTHMDFAAQVYSEILERDLISRVKNGVHNRMVNVANNEEIMRVMFSRMLSRRFTQILFVPLDYLTYIAFDYDERGIGKSLMDEGSSINTMRSVLMVTDLLANIKNTIGRTDVNIKIDEDDPDPEKTLAMAKDWTARSRRIDLPTTASSPSDITDFVNEACIGYTIDTEHPGIPKMSVSVEQKQTNYPRVDSELRDDLKKHSIMQMGMTPEQVDNGLAGEFATTLVMNNIMLSKRVVAYQDAFVPQLSTLVRKIVRFSQEPVEKIRELFSENFEQIRYKIDDAEKAMLNGASDEDVKQYIIYTATQKFVDGLTVSLPRPPSITLENQMAQLDIYSTALDTAIDKAYMNEEAATQEVVGNASANIAAMKAAVKAMFLRRYMASKGILPELQELVTLDDDGQPQINVMDESIRHIEALVRSLVRVAAKTAPLAAAATQDLDRITNGQSSEGGGAVSTDEDEGDGEGSDFGAGDGEDLNMPDM